MWPKDLLDAFDVALQDVELVEGYTKVTALVRFLDAAASMAVWRCKGKPEHLEAAYFFPYTPIGQLTASGMAGTMRRLSLGGPSWGHALDRLKEVVRANAVEICKKYEGDPLPYHHEL
jgi:hypothetical protein